MLQLVALYAPGAMTVRPWLHRRRGVDIGRRVFISTDALIETARPDLVSLGDEVMIGIRSTIIAHFRGGTDAAQQSDDSRFSVRVGDEAFIGPGAIILPGVTIGQGAVVAAGSVVTRSVGPLTMVQGNPAEPVAACGIPLGIDTPYEEFRRQLRPIRPRSRRSSATS